MTKKYNSYAKRKILVKLQIYVKIIYLEKRSNANLSILEKNAYRREEKSCGRKYSG